MEFKKVNINKYIEEGLEKGRITIKGAVKIGRITAIQGTVNQKVETFTQNGLLEKVAMVELDKETKRPGWIVTKVDINGNEIIDEFGHKNQWIISDSIFTNKYEIDPENPSLFKPKEETQIFAQISENILLTQNGSKMKIEKGGYINITNAKNMYGVSKRDFEDTY